MPLANGSGVKAVITHGQPSVVEEAIKEGFFDPPRVEIALRLVRNMRAYTAGVSHLLLLLPLGATRDPDHKQLVLRVIERIEENRRAIVADARLLAEPK